MAKFAEYQWFSTIAPKFGGPKGVIAVAALVGAGLYKGGELAVKQFVKTKASIDAAAESKTFTFTQSAEDGHGLRVTKGGEFRVLNDLGDTIAIEIVGDDQHHYVEATFLERVSAWRRPSAA